jgi:hypothetical protein
MDMVKVGIRLLFSMSLIVFDFRLSFDRETYPPINVSLKIFYVLFSKLLYLLLSLVVLEHVGVGGLLHGTIGKMSGSRQPVALKVSRDNPRDNIQIFVFCRKRY